MKIDAAVRDAFKTQEQAAQELRRVVDPDLDSRRAKSWHYVSRVKGLESFALKVETGRIQSLEEVEDVFAATIVVPEWTQIAAAEELVLRHYELAYRRPSTPDSTPKDAGQFLFDDLRLYVRYRRAPGERSAIPDGLLFEVQIKTFLQHAWAVATHDVVYKTPTRDWRRERIASQVRASLEAAEVAIGNIEALAGTAMLPADNPEILELNATIELLCEHWAEELLPSNLRRLAENVQLLMRVVEPAYSADRVTALRELLEAGRLRNDGAHSLDWSPYRSVLNYVAFAHKGKLKNRVTNTRSAKMLLVYPEVLTAVGLEPAEAVRAVVAKP